MHPLDGLFSGREVVNTVGLAEDSASLFGRCPELSLPTVLDEWYAVAAVFVANSDEEWLTVAGDEHVAFFVDGDAILGKDGDVTIIGGITDAHEGSREVIKQIGRGWWCERDAGKVRQCDVYQHLCCHWRH
jgi:hypothetical protein